MSNPNFLIRNRCPACTVYNPKLIYQNPLTESPIRDYLESFYLPQGRIEFEFLEGALYCLSECSVCGLIFQKEVPNDWLTVRLYEHWIDPRKAFIQHQTQDGLERFSYYAQEIMQITTLFKKKPPALSILDFGMGWGRWALMAKALGCDVYGYEVSAARIDYAKLNSITIISWDEILQHQFDFINTEQVFEHLPDPLQTLRHLKRGLNPDGILKISVPTANNIGQRLRVMDWKSPKGTRNSLNPVAPLEHINFFRRKSMVKMAHIAGMEEVFIPMKYQYSFIANWRGIKQIAKNILLPIYRNILMRDNYFFFRHASETP